LGFVAAISLVFSAVAFLPQLDDSVAADGLRRVGLEARFAPLLEDEVQGGRDVVQRAVGQRGLGGGMRAQAIP